MAGNGGAHEVGPSGGWRRAASASPRHITSSTADQEYFNLDALGIVPAASSPTPAGDVAVSLRVARNPDGSIALSWDASCAPADNDYEVYSGSIGHFESHVSRLCTTGGAMTASLPFLPQDEYYLVVPRNGRREGSYGVGSDGAERPQGNAACLPRAVAASCP